LFLSHSHFLYLLTSPLDLYFSCPLTPIIPPPLLPPNSEAKRLSLSLETMDLVFQGTQELSIPTFKRKMMDLGFRYL
jgi:hypothetical protein